MLVDGKRRDENAPYEMAAPAIARASKLIASSGWVRGELCTERGYCIVGALLATGATVDVQDIAFDFIRSECQSKVVSQWNDHVAQSKKEVVKMLERAASKARNSLAPVVRKAGAERGSIYG